MWLRSLSRKQPPGINGHRTLIAIADISNTEGMVRTHAQSNSNAGLSLACKAGKTQSYFSNQNGDMVTRARAAELHGARARAQHSTEE